MTYYDEISSGYNELHRDEQVKKIKLIKKELNVEKKHKLLDIGCGSGIAFEFFDCKLFGIDPSLELIKQIPVGKIITKAASAERIPFPDMYFDIIISVTAIQNFEDLDRGLTEIKRVAKPKAQIAISCLKKSSKLEEIREKIKEHFEIKKEIEEEKDIIWILSSF
ncbi:class I SAM-dependent methyltransferase [Candidatus Woesearchaeota archaeon]|nr:class I SAM-dependent methyltransferase [Candidatus Woesearchaeota archaeon]